MTMPVLAVLLKKMTLTGARIRKDGRLIEVCVGQADPFRVRSLAYLLLNGFERRYFIVVREMPYCLMPDAWDHIPPSAGGASRDRRCRICRFHLSCAGPKCRVVPVAQKDVPREVAFELTDRCNLRCRTCFHATGSRRLAFERIIAVMKAMRRAGVPQVRFTGGEPLLYSGLRPAVLAAKKMGLEVLLNTNATLIGQEDAEFLACHLDDILVSCQGCDGASEEYLTGGGRFFADKLRHIRMLTRRNLPLRAGTIVTQTLIERLPDYLRLLQSLGVSRWELYRPLPTSFSQKRGMVSRDDFRGLLARLSVYRGDMSIKFANPVPFCMADDLAASCHLLTGGFWDDGHSRLVMDAGGHFKPSYALDTDLGTDMLKAWRHSALTPLRSLSYLSPRCRECAYVYWCRGGSRLWARYGRGSVWSEDPWMPHE